VTAPSNLKLNLPATYLAARNALGEAVRVDAVKDIRDKAIALEVYAYQAKDAQLAGDAAEIKKRAERRIGELMAEMRQADKLAKGARAPGVGRRGKTRVSEKPALSLADQGVDKNLASRARKAAEMPGDQFEAEVIKTRALAVAATEGNKSIIKAARAEQLREKKERREQREIELAQRICALPNQKFGVVLEDFEWDFEVYSRETGMDRHAANHYPTATTAHTAEEVIERTKDRFRVAAKDCALFMCVPIPFLAVGVHVLEGRGFRYVSNFTWEKDDKGTGYWIREKHEHVLIGVRGSVPCPAPGDQFNSVLKAARREHSQKPEIIYEVIEKYFPNVPKIELNARSGRAGWTSWGNEAPADDLSIPDFLRRSLTEERS
jgi:N6-adenosine-specific RNA methylase IME4